jgi:hypothetical protein
VPASAASITQMFASAIRCSYAKRSAACEYRKPDVISYAGDDHRRSSAGTRGRNLRECLCATCVGREDQVLAAGHPRHTENRGDPFHESAFLSSVERNNEES